MSFQTAIITSSSEEKNLLDHHLIRRIAASDTMNVRDTTATVLPPTLPSKLFNDDLDFPLQMVYEGFKPDIPTGVYVDYEKVEIFERDHNRFRPLTNAEWDSIAYDAPEIKLGDFDEDPYYQTFTAPNGRNFTVRELVQVVKKYEQGARNREFEDDYEWEAIKGIDNHHIHFEGLKGGRNGVWYI
ncbi:hypothetical protein HK097_006681 [Rhizophlyctis rosea]|uniref:Uncharacterized protein n=1 Tax=Rhizophlyctis rosea TaxID=64517 RepID=A0AAD5WWD3_9FUNG|nr:hypothetical protein HK097_006681 [Rhizophlyctis rosea]